jgi:6-phosphogluconate dehydrogenase
MRQISALKEERVVAAQKLGIAQNVQVDETLGPDVVHFVVTGLHLAFIVAYAQGFSLLRVASAEKNYELHLAEIVKIWRGGCIIRSKILDTIRTAFTATPDLPNLLVADNLRETIQKEQNLLKATLKFALAADVP